MSKPAHTHVRGIPLECAQDRVWARVSGGNVWENIWDKVWDGTEAPLRFHIERLVWGPVFRDVRNQRNTS